MKVLKFGGGCLKDAKSIQKVPKIISHYEDDIIIVVLSAFGKITNMLEDEKYLYDQIVRYDEKSFKDNWSRVYR